MIKAAYPILLILTACSSSQLGSGNIKGNEFAASQDIPFYAESMFDDEAEQARSKAKPAQNKQQAAFQNKKHSGWKSAAHCRDIDSGGDINKNINDKLDCMIEVVKGY